MPKSTKIIVLYGPPGVGKLTVAKQLARLTGYKIFHNQLTLDPVVAIVGFDFENKEAFDLVDKYRLEILGIAAKQRVPGVIFTTLYGGTAGEERWFKQLVGRTKRYGAKVYFVQLMCDIDELKRRIPRKDRKRYWKLVNLKKLGPLMDKFDIFSKVRSQKSVSIDNTRLPPIATAKRIKQYIS